MAKKTVSSFKIVLLGESSVGKSSLVLQFVRNQFEDHRESTIGAAFLTQTVDLDDSSSIKFEIWDTAGQERYKSLAPMYYRSASAAIVVYDITNAASLDKAKSWILELQRQADADIVIALVGNKSDLSERRAISSEEGKKYADEEKLLFFETSAKTAENVELVFTSIAKKMPTDKPRPKARAARDGVTLDRQTGQQSDQPCAC